MEKVARWLCKEALKGKTMSNSDLEFIKAIRTDQIVLVEDMLRLVKLVAQGKVRHIDDEDFCRKCAEAKQ